MASREPAINREDDGSSTQFVTDIILFTSIDRTPNTFYNH